MRNAALLSLAAVLALSSVQSAQQAGALKAAADAMGVTRLQSVEYTGAGANFFVGQAYRPGDAWPVLPTRNYTVSIDYEATAIRVDRTNEMGLVMPLGGGPPFRGSQRVAEVARGQHAWNVALPATDGGPAEGQIYRQGARPGQVVPLMQTAPERMMQILLTPHGFIRGALANQAATRSVRDGTEVSFTVAGGYKVVGLVNRENLVERVRTAVDSPIVGDLPLEVTYSGYRDFGGFQFPSHIAQRAGGHPSLDLWIVSATANPRLDFAVPDSVRDRDTSPVAMEAQALAEGVYLLSGRGTSSSLVVEMQDHLVVCEANTEEHALGIIARTKEMFPGKPIRYVVNTHHHWDHSTGLRVYAAAGVTIVTHQQNQKWFEQALGAPRTINPFRRPQATTPPRFHAVGDRGELTDGQRVMELHVITNLRHATGMLMVYLPKERILFEADAWTPPPDGQPTPPAVVPMAHALHDGIRRLNLKVDQILPNHNRSSEVQRGRLYPMAELTRAVSDGATN